MARFKPGDRVRILPDMATPFVGLEGIIQEINANDLNVSTLDRYLVMFEWGERQSFYDAQLSPTGDQGINSRWTR
jgi:hypothetical protein